MSAKKLSSRILALDLMRGYFLVIIILDHLFWYPNGLDWVSGRGELFVSAAEGFFLISGIVLGIVRGQKLINKPFAVGAKLLLKRSVQLYITSVVLMLIFTLLGWWFFMNNPGLKPGIRPPSEGFWSVFIGALDYKYIYGWADFLRLYAIFIFVSPLVLWLLRRGWWYIVLGLSVGTYLLLPFAQAHTTYTDELLMPITWQLIFFGGFVIGFHEQRIRRFWQSLSHRFRRIFMRTVFVLTTITLGFNMILAFGSDLSSRLGAIEAALDPFFIKETLPPARIALFALWFVAGFWLFHHYREVINRRLGWILLPFGMNSLYVYTIHAFVIFFVHMVMLNASPNILINIVGTLLVLGIILLAVRTKFLMKIIPR